MPAGTDTMAELDYIYSEIQNNNDSYTVLVDKETAYQCMQALYEPYMTGRGLSWIREDVSMEGTRQYFVHVDRDTVYTPKTGETVLLDAYYGTTRPMYYTCFLGGAIRHNSDTPLYGRINTAEDNKRSIHAEGYVNLYAKISGAPSCTLTLSPTGEQGTGQDIKNPLDTVTAQDRFGLVTVNGVDYQIVDIGLRMLEPRELYGCQGFPDDYIIDRDYTGKAYPRSEQVRRCGNAVCPPIPAALVRANLPDLCVAERTPNCVIREEDIGQLRFA